jgi:hypothetical protein
MVEIVDMDMREIIFLLPEVDYAHLACARCNHPHVIPIHYVYREPFIYIFTTEGKMTDILAYNPEVCIQVEKVISASQWRSAELNNPTIHKDHYQRPLAAATARRSPILSVMIPETPIWATQAISSLSLMVHAIKESMCTPAFCTAGSELTWFLRRMSYSMVLR